MGIFSKLKKSDNSEYQKKQSDEARARQDEDVSLAEEKAKVAMPTTSKNGRQSLTDTGLAYKWLVKPIITEKATYLSSFNKYIFAVAPGANKIEIKKAVKKVYGVEVLKVNIINKPGKTVRYGRKIGRTKVRRQAVVTLAAGQTIQLYEGV
ncbi:MAG: 50S ribosomal protein L23 [Candidatus Komeilibacteria bacterium]|nr:50S ribosomal protein L23 [Candidatus Komeilibacteria bacterium]